MGQGGKRRLLGIGAALVLVVAATVTTAGALSTPTWDVQPSTNRGGDSNLLNDVSCPSATFCVAVGAYRDFRFPVTKPEGTLIETYANGTWTTKASPGQGGVSRLNGVSCPTTTRCYAVGESHTSTGPLIVQWSGGAWTSVTPPVGADPGDLQDIDCVDATHCVAVGTRAPNGTGPFALVLAGSTWSVATLPNVGSGLLYDVSCVAAGSCTSVGYRIGTGGVGRSLVLRLANGTWSKVGSPNRTARDNRWYGVSCTSVSRCTAVGTYTSTAGPQRVLRATWVDTAWTLQAGSTVGATFAVDCTVASTCTSVGEQNGRAVANYQAPGTFAGTAFAATSNLLGVDCVSAKVCVAVGHRSTADPFVAHTLVTRSH